MNIPIPEGLRHHFWEHDASNLSWPENRGTIIAKLMLNGADDAARWLLEHATTAEIRAWIEARQGKGIPPARLRFWASAVDLDQNDVHAWIARWNDSVWGRRAR